VRDAQGQTICEEGNSPYLTYLLYRYPVAQSKVNFFPAVAGVFLKKTGHAVCSDCTHRHSSRERGVRGKPMPRASVRAHDALCDSTSASRSVKPNCASNGVHAVRTSSTHTRVQRQPVENSFISEIRVIRGSPRVGKVRKVRVLIRTTNITNITNFYTLRARNVARWREASRRLRRGECCQIDDRFSKNRGDFVSQLPEVW
jgi:hypothetical protein